jgi:hypothetical protein
MKLGSSQRSTKMCNHFIVGRLEKLGAWSLWSLDFAHESNDGQAAFLGDSPVWFGTTLSLSRIFSLFY